MLEFNPLYYKQKPSAKYHLIFFFCNFIIDFLSFRRCSTKGAALRKEPHTFLCFLVMQIQNVNVKCIFLWNSFTVTKDFVFKITYSVLNRAFSIFKIESNLLLQEAVICDDIDLLQMNIKINNLICSKNKFYEIYFSSNKNMKICKELKLL